LSCLRYRYRMGLRGATILDSTRFNDRYAET